MVLPFLFMRDYVTNIEHFWVLGVLGARGTFQLSVVLRRERFINIFVEMCLLRMWIMALNSALFGINNTVFFLDKYTPHFESAFFFNISSTIIIITFLIWQCIRFYPYLYTANCELCVERQNRLFEFSISCQTNLSVHREVWRHLTFCIHGTFIFSI